MDNITLKTELVYKKSKPIDKLNTFDGIKLMISEQKQAAINVEQSLLSLEIAINRIYEHLISNENGRIIYTGAGTSGRIGVQDGIELFPTFNWPKTRVDYLIAGGNKAILDSIENAEDDTEAATILVNRKKINSHDVLIGLTASGNTPFTCKVMKEAKNKNALTIAISNNPEGKVLEYGDVKIILNTKEEVIAGSTRLKAGTAQKISLNVISSMVMLKMGKVKNGYMIDMVPTNEKLRKRKIFINSKI